MFLLSFITAIISLLMKDVFCFVPQQHSINIQPPPAIISPEIVPLPLDSGIPVDEGGQRNVYDPGDADLSEDYDDVLNEVQRGSATEVLHKLEDDIKLEQEIASKSAILMKMLEDPNISTLPVVYVEEPLETDFYPMELQKRSRYYRRYPWKRHSRNRSTYEPDARYLCVPSREDVFKLLVGIHENRIGNHHKTVNFCNRRRPAKAIFTNIRFLG